MSTPWPQRERFNADLERWMRRAGLKTRADLARAVTAAGGYMHPSTPTTWSNRYRPGRDALRAVSEVLGVSLAEMELSAGLALESEVTVDRSLDWLPEQIIELIQDWQAAIDETPELVPELLDEVARATNHHQTRLALRLQRERKSA